MEIIPAESLLERELQTILINPMDRISMMSPDPYHTVRVLSRQRAIQHCPLMKSTHVLPVPVGDGEHPPCVMISKYKRNAGGDVISVADIIGE